MLQQDSGSKIEARVYFVISPTEGPDFQTYDDEDIQAIGGVHALERSLEGESYWFAHVGQIWGETDRYHGVTFSDSDFARLPEPDECALRIGRLNPAFGKSDIEKLAFRQMFKAVQRMLDTWEQYVDQTIEAYALKELKISSQQLVSLSTGLCAVRRVHELVQITVAKFWYDPTWPGKPMPSDLVLDEYSFKIPIQLRWATGDQLISAEVLPAALC